MVPRLVVKLTTVPSATRLLYLSTTVAVTVDVLPPIGMLGGTATRVTVKGRPGVKVTIAVPTRESAVAVTTVGPTIKEVTVDVATPAALVVLVGGAVLPGLAVKVTTAPLIRLLN
jgi:hypothetical protein